MVASPDRKGCVRMFCKERQKLMVDGSCEDCGDYTRAQDYNRECRADACEER